jgi:hypothetical protein
MFRRRLPVIQDIGAEIARLLMSSCRQAVTIAPRPDCRRHRAPFIEANSAQDEAISGAPNWIGCWRSGARVTPWSCTAWTGWRATSMTCGPSARRDPPAPSRRTGSRPNPETHGRNARRRAADMIRLSDHASEPDDCASVSPSVRWVSNSVRPPPPPPVLVNARRKRPLIARRTAHQGCI